MITHWTTRVAAAVLLLALLPAALIHAQSTRRVWAGPEFDQLGGPSPDGQLITFVDWTTGDLAVNDLRTQTKRRLTTRGTFAEQGAFRDDRQEFALYSMFSPSGRQVAFTWYRIDITDVARTGFAPVTVELRVVDTTASESRVLFSVRGERGYVQPVDWARDGQSILATGTAEDGTGRVMIVPLAGDARIIKSFPDWRTPSTAKLSPDGKYIAYDYQPKRAESRSNIYLLPLAGGSEAVLVDDVPDAVLAGWSPDGSHILFASERGGTPGLWALAVEAGRARGAPRLVKKDMWRSAPVSVTADGKYFYSVQAGDQDIYVASYDGAGKLQSSPIAVAQPGQRWHQNPRWSADGKYLAYVTTGIGSQLVGGNMLTIYSVEARERRQLRPPVAYLSAAYWMPGSRALSLRAWDDRGRSALLKLDLGTNDISTIATLATTEAGLQPAFSPDGRWLYMSPAQKTPTQRERRIVVRDMKSGEERDLYVAPQGPSRAGPGGSPMFVSPDGRWLAVAIHTDTVNLRRVVVIPTAGGSARVLFGRSPDGEPVSRVAGFSGDSKLVFYATAANPSTNKLGALWRVSVDGGESQRVEVPAKDFRFPAVSPDGRRVAYGAGELATELWVLEDVGAGLRTTNSSSRRR